VGGRATCHKKLGDGGVHSACVGSDAFVGEEEGESAAEGIPRQV